MRIQNVRVVDLTHLPHMETYRATLQLLTDRGGITLNCKARLGESAPRPDILRTLLEDAISQLGRMPEVRTGRQTVELAENALHSELNEA